MTQKRGFMFSMSTFMFALILLAEAVITPLSVWAAPVRARNTQTVKSGCYIVNVAGSFENPNVTLLLKRINEIRYEACVEGVPDPRNSARRLTKADYVPIKWSTELEKMAMLRAAEATIVWGHNRPNGESDPWNAAYGKKSYAENLAPGDTKEAIETFYSEKSAWKKIRVYNNSTGHYSTMIDPSYKYVSLGSFKNSLGRERAAMELSFETNLSETKVGKYGSYIQQIEMTKSIANQYLAKDPSATVEEKVVEVVKISLNKSRVNIAAGESVTLKTTVSPSGALNKTVKWTTSDSSVAKVSGGKVTAIKAGNATITAVSSNGKKASCKITVFPIKQGNYTLYSALGNNCVLDIAGGSSANGANAQIYRANGTKAQIFRVSWNSDGTITITNIKSGKVLDAKGRGTSNGTNVWQYIANQTAAQKWVMKAGTLPGYYIIKASYGNLVLDVRGGSSKNGTNVQLYTSNGTKAQQWKLVSVS